MITREYGKLVAHCFYCDDHLHTGTADFDEARACLAAEDWATIKIKGEWENLCPDCAEQGAEDEYLSDFEAC